MNDEHYEKQRREWEESMARGKKMDEEWQAQFELTKAQFERAKALNDRTEKLLDRLEAFLDLQESPK